ncbi:MAG: GTPase [Saccharolobus sp.]
MLNPFEKLKLPQKTNDTINVMLKRLPKISGESIKDREIRRLKEYYDRVKKYYEFVQEFPRIETLHPFYLEAIKIVADINELKLCLFETKKSSSISMKILKNYIEKIRKSDEREANKLMREAFGRVSSILRKTECINKIIDIVIELKRIKSIDPTLPSIIVSGPPNVGKSTLVSKISTAKPEIANYPFTTKEIHVGHILTNDIHIQVIDTPGILDRPENKRNKIEKKALNAIRNLNGVILFMFDPSISSAMSVEEQIELFKEIISYRKLLVPVINKIDDKYDEYYDRIVKFLIQENVKWFEISAEKSIGIDKLLQELFNLLKVSGTNEIQSN